MIKKSIALFSIFSLMVFSLSCYVTKTREIKSVDDWEGRNIEVLKVEKNSGETVEFSEKQPGKIPEKSILIVFPKKMKLELDVADIKDIKKEGKKQKVKEITTNDGKYYYVISAKENDDKMIITAYEAIPLTDVKMVVFKDLDPIPTLIVYVVLIVGALYGGLLLLFSGVRE